MTLEEVADNHGLTPEGVDYALRQYQIVVSEITHGLLSKLSYDAHDVLQCAQERWCDTCELKAQEVPAVPLEPLCELLAEMYHCPGSGWPSSNRACHPYCPDEAFEKLCGIDCDNYTDAERWKAFLAHWMGEQT